MLNPSTEHASLFAYPRANVEQRSADGRSYIRHDAEWFVIFRGMFVARFAKRELARRLIRLLKQASETG